MADCIFCRIVAGEVPARKVYEDEEAVGFLDAFPLAEGHTLVVPRRHVGRVAEMDDAQARAVFAAAHKLAGRVQKATGAPASTLAVNDGREAGQEVPHVHVHIVPRHEGDGAGPIHALPWPRPKVPEARMDELAKALRALP